MYPSTNYSHDVELKKNKYGELGLFAKNPIDEGDIVCYFAINNLVTSDANVIEKLKKSLSGIIPDSNIAKFSLALNILYHPKKYDFINKYILQNYSPYKPFLFRDTEMKLLKDTAVYYLTRTEKLYFELMLTQYRNYESDITYNAEHKLRVIYSFCMSKAHNIQLQDVLMACINPSSVINHTYNETYPKLKHEIQDNKWTVFADKNYEPGEEILDCYRLGTVMSHPYYKTLQFNDWKIPMAVSAGFSFDDQIIPNMGFVLNGELNENKMKLLDKIYSDERLDELRQTTGDKRYMGCLKVSLQLLELEKKYYNLFKESLKKNMTDVNLEIA